MIKQRQHLTNKKRNSVLLILAFGLIGSSSAIAKDAAADMVTVQQSRPLVARAGAWQTYGEHIDIKRGQEKRHLVLTFTNGADGKEKLTDATIELDKKPYAALKDFDDKGTLTRSLTGKVHPGNIPMTIKVFGPSGARLTWKLSADKVKEAVKVEAKVAPHVTRIDHASPPGQPLVISGRGFSKVPAENKVNFGGLQAKVVSSSETSITCIIPEMHFPTWHVPIFVTTKGGRSKEKVTINVDMRVIPNDGHPQL